MLLRHVRREIGHLPQRRARTVIADAGLPRMRKRRGIVAARSQPSDLSLEFARVTRVPGTPGGQLGAETAEFGTCRPGRVVDDRDRRIGAVPGRRPRFQSADQLVRICDPELGQPAEVEPVGAGQFPGPFGGFLLGRGESSGCGLYLGGEPVLLGARRLQRPPPVLGLGEQSLQLPDGLPLAVGDGLRLPAGARQILLPAVGGRVVAGRAPGRGRRLLGPALRGIQRAARGFGPACGFVGAHPPFLHLGGQPVTVPLPDARRLVPASRLAKHLLEPLGVPHRRVLLQRFAPRLELGPPLLELVQFALCRPQLRVRRGERLLRRGQVPAELLVPALRLTWPGRLALSRDHGVPAVMPEEVVRGLPGLGQSSQRVAFLVQPAKRLGDRRHQARAERRQRFGQRARQQLLVGLLGKLRLPELDQQVDQHVVAVLTEPEQGFVHRPAVVGGPVVHQPVPVDLLAQLLPGERNPARRQQAQVVADPLGRDEEPVACDATAGDGFQPAADSPELGGPVGGAAAELEPRVPDAFRMGMLAAQQQVPLHFLLPVAVRLHPMRCELSIQQERQRQRQHLGLAGSVVAAQQETAVVEPELLGVVVEHVDQAGTQRLPPLRTGRWQHRLSPFSSRLVSSGGWWARPERNARSPGGCGPPAHRR